MATEPELDSEGRWNYFNYFTEIEEHFQRVRGSALFLLSPVDWALIESWKNSGIPLEAVLRGIDAAFEKWHTKKHKQRAVNSVAYCAQAVADEAQALATGVAPRSAKAEAPFTLEEVTRHLAENQQRLESKAGYGEIAAGLVALLGSLAELYEDLEDLERRLTALEDRMSAIARTRVCEEDLVAARRELDATLRPYRSKMNTAQLAMLERQYLDRRILESADLPRLSLFYLK